MILAHAIIGIMPVEDNFSWFWFFGSVIPDLDHIFIIFKNKFFSINKLIDSISYEEKYDVNYKTKYFHSILGAIIVSLAVSFISLSGGVYFLFGYLLHLALDFPDKDEKQYFYPFKLKVKGWAPIFSKQEIVFTACLIVFLIAIYRV